MLLLRLYTLLCCVYGAAYAAPKPTIASDKAIINGLQQQDSAFFETRIDKTRARTPGGKASVLKYGPFRVNAMSMLNNKLEARVARPCNDCFIIAMQADLVSSNGTSVNINEGGWLHHMVLYDTGRLNTGPRDPICRIYPRRIFASGNERMPIRLNGKYNYGVELDSGDNIMMIVELMNESHKAQSYFIEMTYEYIPKSAARGYKPAQVAWLDVAGCMTGGEVHARTGRYELKSTPWPSTYTGRMITATGHTHDGGDKVVVYKNGRPVCRASQVYADKPEYKGGMSQTSHISDTATCVDFGEVRRGDVLHIGAKYDTTAHQLDKEMNGRGNMPIMGISLVYIG